MSNTFDSSVSIQLSATTVPLVIVGDLSSNVAVANTQEVKGNNGIKMIALFSGIY